MPVWRRRQLCSCAHGRRESSTPSRRVLRKRATAPAVGDEGGFAPALKSADEALTFIMKSIEKAGYKPGDDVVLALDCASTEFFKGGKYELAGEGKSLDSAGMAKYLEDLVKRFPIVSIEDGMAEDDWAGWKVLTRPWASVASSSETISSSPIRNVSVRVSGMRSPTRFWSR